MFKKNHKVRIECGEDLDFIKILGKYGVKFEMSEPFHRNHPKKGRIRYRVFTIRATQRTYKKILADCTRA